MKKIADKPFQESDDEAVQGTKNPGKLGYARNVKANTVSRTADGEEITIVDSESQQA